MLDNKKENHKNEIQGISKHLEQKIMVLLISIQDSLQQFLLFRSLSRLRWLADCGSQEGTIAL